MSEYCHIVPWYNSEEWRKVYHQIYSQSSSFINKQEALNILLIWKARCPSLPAGIESTLTLLQVYIEDISNTDGTFNEQLLQLAYSSAIMRFVNHTLDCETAKGLTLFQAAKSLGVPDWIVDLRHDAAHGGNLPSIELLRDATLFGLQWLKENYWDKYKEYIKDYVIGQNAVDNNDENAIVVFMNFCISLSICSHPRSKIKNLAEILDVSMKESIMNDAKVLFGDQIDFSNLKKVSIMALINMLDKHSKVILKIKNMAVYVNKVLLGEDSLFLSTEALNCVNNIEFFHKNSLNKSYIQCFELLLTLLHRNDLLLDFVLGLINITQNSNDSQKCQLAALWTSIILRALRRSKLFTDRMEKVSFDEMKYKKRKELKLLFHHWFPNENNEQLVLDLLKPVPEQLSNINFIQPIISSYNPYLTYFIKDLLNLVEPNLPRPNLEQICKLAQVISNPQKFPMAALKIYTVEDLKLSEDLSFGLKDHDMNKPIQDQDTDKNIEDQEDDSDCVEVCNEIKEHESEIEIQLKDGIWRLASNKYDWSNCPIGVLPWQLNNETHMEI